MHNQPVVVEQRAEQTSVGIRKSTTMATLAPDLLPLLQEVFGFLARQALSPAGPPFWRYHCIDMAANLEVEVGVPIIAAGAGTALNFDGGTRVELGALPAGRYATVMHTGHPDRLLEATLALLEWANAEGETWDMTPTPEGERWGCRLEEYLTDPAEQPDMNQWQTRLAFRLR